MKIGNLISISFPWDNYRKYTEKDPILNSISKEHFIWDRFLHFFRGKSALYSTIEEKAKEQNPAKGWNETLPFVSSALTCSEYHLLRKDLRTIIKSLSKEELGTLFNDLVERSFEDDGLIGIRRILTLVTPDELEKTILQESSSPKETLYAFRIAANEYKKLTKTHEATPIEWYGNAVIKTIRGTIDAILLSFRITDVSADVTTNSEGTEKWQAYTKLIGLPLILFGALLTFLPPLTALIVAGAIVATLATAAFAYVKWLRQSPDTIENTVNLTIEAQLGKLAPVYARDKEIDEILASLASSSKEHRSHPLLIGPSGVGKTEIVRGIAQRLLSGNVPESLKGKKLLHINTQELFDRGAGMFGGQGGAGRMGGMGEQGLQRILTKMNEKQSDYIVFFDNVHAAMTKRTDAAEKLKMALDINPNSLPYCIGATTEQHYENHMAEDPDFLKLFRKIQIAPQTKGQSVLILREMLNREAPELTISNEVLEYIYDISCEKLPKLAQPAACKLLLAKAIGTLSHQTNPHLQKYRDKLSEIASSIRESRDTSYAAKISKIQEKIRLLEENEKQSNQRIKKLHSLIKCKKEETNALFEKTDDYNHFLFWNYLFLPKLSQKITTLQDACQETRSSRIDKPLIDKLICEISG